MFYNMNSTVPTTEDTGYTMMERLFKNGNITYTLLWDENVTDTSAQDYNKTNNMPTTLLKRTIYYSEMITKAPFNFQTDSDDGTSTSNASSEDVAYSTTKTIKLPITSTDIFSSDTMRTSKQLLDLIADKSPVSDEITNRYIKVANLTHHDTYSDPTFTSWPSWASLSSVVIMCMLLLIMCVIVKLSHNHYSHYGYKLIATGADNKHPYEYIYKPTTSNNNGTSVTGDEEYENTFVGVTMPLLHENTNV